MRWPVRLLCLRTEEHDTAQDDNLLNVWRYSWMYLTAKAGTRLKSTQLKSQLTQLPWPSERSLVCLLTMVAPVSILCRYGLR